MSRSRPISGLGSTGAASSTAPSAATHSARRRSSRRNAGRCPRWASTSNSGSPGTICSCPLRRWALAAIQRDEGESVYLRLSTRPTEQPERELDDQLAQAIIAGGYWLREPGPDAELAIVYSGALAAEALAAWEVLRDELPRAGVLAVTSADRLHRNWCEAAARGDVGTAGHVLL